MDEVKGVHLIYPFGNVFKIVNESYKTEPKAPLLIFFNRKDTLPKSNQNLLEF